MNKRPWSVTIIACLFLAAGVLGLAYHATEFKTSGPFRYDLVWVGLVRLAAIICAGFMLRGHNWARWGLLVWMACHVILSAFHSPTEVVVHSLLFAVIAYLLLRGQTTAYFRRACGQAAQTPNRTNEAS